MDHSPSVVQRCLCLLLVFDGKAQPSFEAISASAWSQCRPGNLLKIPVFVVGIDKQRQDFKTQTPHKPPPLLQNHQSPVSERNMRNNCMCLSAYLTLLPHLNMQSLCFSCVMCLPCGHIQFSGLLYHLPKWTTFALGNQCSVFFLCYFS